LIVFAVVVGFLISVVHTFAQKHAAEVPSPTRTAAPVSLSTAYRATQAGPLEGVPLAHARLSQKFPLGVRSPAQLAAPHGLVAQEYVRQKSKKGKAKKEQ
jgi:hypothetical protein